VKKMLCLILLINAITVNAYAKELPTDTKEYVYGLGEDNSYERAQQAALANIAQKLSTRVKSNTEITHRKEGKKANTVAINNILSYSRDIELPNVEVIENKEKNGIWTVVVKANRKNIQIALKHQLNSLNEDLLFVLDEFRSSYGPACYYSLSEKASSRERLVDLIPAYVGSGINDDMEQEFYITIQLFDKTFAKCEKRNKYRLKFSKPVSTTFNNDVRKFLKSKGFVVTKSTKNTGEIHFNLQVKQSFAYNNHLSIIAAEVIVMDELEEIRYEEKFKVKGSSFNSKSDALTRAQSNLLKKIKSTI